MTVYDTAVGAAFTKIHWYLSLYIYKVKSVLILAYDYNTDNIYANLIRIVLKLINYLDRSNQV